MAVVLAVSDLSDESREGETHVRNAGIATGVSEARSQQCRGKKTPTFVLQAVTGGRVRELRCIDDPPKRFWAS
jgi:hypothetical protein